MLESDKLLDGLRDLEYGFETGVTSIRMKMVVQAVMDGDAPPSSLEGFCTVIGVHGRPHCALESRPPLDGLLLAGKYHDRYPFLAVYRDMEGLSCLEFTDDLLLAVSLADPRLVPGSAYAHKVEDIEGIVRDVLQEHGLDGGPENVRKVIESELPWSCFAAEGDESYIAMVLSDVLSDADLALAPARPPEGGQGGES